MKNHLIQLVGDRAALQGRNVAREYLQSRILGALQRAGAMTSLAFQGGTCLRFVFNLPRFSEDLDFALEGDASDYDLGACLKSVRSLLAAENYHVETRLREQRTVHGAVVRFPGILYESGLSPHPAEVLAVRVEVDTRPPAGARTAITLVRRHVTLRLYHHDRASLLAGKLRAVLQRPFAKGRDLFDLIWYLSDPEWPAPNLALLNEALRQTDWRGEELTQQTWRSVVRQRIEELDWDHVVRDVIPFLEHQNDVDLLTRDNAMRLLEA